MVAVFPPLPAGVLTGKVVLVDPAGTVTLAGTEATAELLLVSNTSAPPVGAAADKVTVAVEAVPLNTGFGLRLREDSAKGSLDPLTVSSVPTCVVASVPGELRSRTQFATKRLSVEGDSEKDISNGNKEMEGTPEVPSVS
jgi:hypothetical protein